MKRTPNTFGWHVQAQATLADVVPPGLASSLPGALAGEDSSLPSVETDGRDLRVRMVVEAPTREEAAAEAQRRLTDTLAELGAALDGPVTATVSV